MSGEGPRNPNHLPALLNFCVQHTRSEDAPNTSNSTMDPERRRWLEEALTNMTVSPVEEMEKNLKVIKDRLAAQEGESPTDETCNTLESAMDCIIDHVSSLDYAKDFHKIGGFDVLGPLLGFPRTSVRSKAAELIAELVQNNPYCQNAALQYIPRLLNLLDTDPDDQVKIKSLYAVSCMVRQNRLAYREFETKDGFSVLVKTLQRPVSKLRIKACFLITSLCNQEPKFRETIVSMGFIEQLAALIQEDHDVHHEHLLSALLALVTDHMAARDECRRPELHMESLLRTRCQELGDKDEFREEAQYCAQILELCFDVQANQMMKVS